MDYKELAECYHKLESTSKRLEKTEILSDFLKKLKKEKNKKIIYLIQGRTTPDYSDQETGVSKQLSIKAIARATGAPEKEIISEWRKIGDIGEVAEKLSGKKGQKVLFKSKLTAEKVLDNIDKISQMGGKGTVDKKLALIAELLSSASPLEAKYIIRTLIGDLRVGVASGTLRDAIVQTCFKEKTKENSELVENAYDLATDFALVFDAATNGTKALREIQASPGKPMKVMLAQKAESISQAFEKVGRPAIFEYKYDGFRVMINKNESGNIQLFTRRLENVTNQFPDVVKFAKENIKAKNFIIDTEVAGYDPKTKIYRPFQQISQRIKRKYDIERLEKELPVEVNAFDILFLNGKNLIKEPLKERRKILEKIIKPVKYKIRLSEKITTDKESVAETFYKKALKVGEEGVMIKALNSPYKPGSRVGYMLKLKPTEREMDLVITKAEYGQGKRAGWFSSFTIACKDKDKFLEIGKVGTGIKEKETGISFEQLTKLLKPLITKEHGRTVEVKPKIILTVIYQEIQKSPSYSSGYALRFPRVTALRQDKPLSEIQTLEEVKRDYKKQSVP